MCSPLFPGFLIKGVIEGYNNLVRVSLAPGPASHTPRLCFADPSLQILILLCLGVVRGESRKRERRAESRI